jgi:flagellar biosynthetic protein FliP
MVRAMNKTLHFGRHYVEMVIAMMLGMLVFSVALGSPYEDAPELALLGMTVAMTIPMVAWMRRRGHGWAPAWEMTASMFVPTFLAIALLWADVLESGHAAMGIQHAIMFPAMLGVMFLRLDEYTGHARGSVAQPDRPAGSRAARA